MIYFSFKQLLIMAEMKMNNIELDLDQEPKKGKPKVKFEFEEPIFFDQVFPGEDDPYDFDEPILLKFKQKENFNDN